MVRHDVMMKCKGKRIITKNFVSPIKWILDLQKVHSIRDTKYPDTKPSSL
jgi:hypothetical protein